MSRTQRVRAPMTLLAGILLAGCAGTGGASAPAPTPSPKAGPAFTLEVLAPREGIYQTSPTPATSTCRLPATGAWTFTYTAAASGDTPFIDLGLTLFDGAATKDGSDGVRLEISVGDPRPLPPLTVDPQGRISGSNGTTASITLASDGVTQLIDIVASAYTRQTRLQDLTLHVACPIG